MRLTPEAAYAKAIAIVGSQAELARLLKIKRQSIRAQKMCPWNRVLELEKLTGGKVTRYQLRPDIYPREPQVPKEGRRHGKEA